MKKIFIMFLCMAALVFVSCDNTSSSDESITVSISNLPDSGTLVIAIFADGANPGEDDPLGGQIAVLSASSTSSFILKKFDSSMNTTSDDWIADAALYDVYMFVDTDDSMSPGAGEYYYEGALDYTGEYLYDLSYDYDTDFIQMVAE